MRYLALNLVIFQGLYTLCSTIKLVKQGKKKIVMPREEAFQGHVSIHINYKDLVILLHESFQLLFFSLGKAYTFASCTYFLII